jgi:hypothetical protein
MSLAVISTPPRTPFLGLRGFTEETTDLFFGRDEEVDELIAVLHRSRLVTVLGSSGSGKSSLVAAGLVPALRAGYLAEVGSSWHVVRATPGADPIGNLVTAFADKNDAGRMGVEALIRRGPLGLVEAVEKRRFEPRTNILVIADQFEELYRYLRDTSEDPKRARPAQVEAADYVKLLLDAAAQREISVFVVITMRSDFLGECTRFRNFPESINKGLYLVPRMRRDQLEHAITGPMRVVDASIEPRLIERILNDVGENEDQLPVLQHALLRMWNQRKSGDPLDLPDYEAVGGLHAALDRHAEEIYKELSGRRQRLAQAIFRRLTEVDEPRVIRRSARIEDLSAVAAVPTKEVQTVIDTFSAEGVSFLTQARLLVDITHESLIRQWSRLRGWARQEAADRKDYEEAAAAASRQIVPPERRTAVRASAKTRWLHGDRLDRAERWLEKGLTEGWAGQYRGDYHQTLEFIRGSLKMAPIAITAIRFAPPMAIARVGASPSPLEAFTWVEDSGMFGAGRTAIRPEISLQVLPSGSVEPYLPHDIRFKDEGMIRPVCPFFELHATWKTGDSNGENSGPLTTGLLQSAGLGLHSLYFRITAANRKAARRTGEEGSAFQADLMLPGNDHGKRQLMAYSRARSGSLVSSDRPILLGAFQVIRPSSTAARVLGVRLDTIRVRFTPATGEVYGPPQAATGQAEYSRSSHTIVPEQNRILNWEASWAKYDSDAAAYPIPVPPGTFDGESDPARFNVSWGVVDDTCDAIIEATLKGGSQTLTSTARVLVGPPDFAPDRRPFYSIADDLADRQAAPVPARFSDVQDAVFDLFQRILETANQMDLDRQRIGALQDNGDISGLTAATSDLPSTGQDTMTVNDKIDGRVFLSSVGQQFLTDSGGTDAAEDVELPRADLAADQHEHLAEPEYLAWFLLQNEDRVRDIVRPPYARVSELPKLPRQSKLRQFRDPRTPRDLAHDMRMPPYMRDSDGMALSITRRQWELLDRYLREMKTHLHEGGAFPHDSRVQRHTRKSGSNPEQA